MKMLKTMMTAAVALAVTSSAALASRPEDDWVSDHIESRFDVMIGDLQAAVGLDFLSREGFYVVAGIAAVLVLYGFAQIMGAAQDADELNKQRREVKARKQAEAEYEAAEARKRNRRYGG